VFTLEPQGSRPEKERGYGLAIFTPVYSSTPTLYCSNRGRKYLVVITLFDRLKILHCKNSVSGDSPEHNARLQASHLHATINLVHLSYDWISYRSQFLLLSLKVFILSKSVSIQTVEDLVALVQDAIFIRLRYLVFRFVILYNTFIMKQHDSSAFLAVIVYIRFPFSARYISES
jgi:hypothetical protein